MAKSPAAGRHAAIRPAFAFAPNGPIRDDLNLKLEDFFWEPFYQLLRQQMLAFQMEKAREAETDRVRVLHISPAGNRRLHAVTSKALNRFGWMLSPCSPRRWSIPPSSFTEPLSKCSVP